MSQRREICIESPIISQRRHQASQAFIRDATAASSFHRADCFVGRAGNAAASDAIFARAYWREACSHNNADDDVMARFCARSRRV